MSRSQFTALAAALALGAFAPRLMAQDTSSTAPTRPDTSGYTTGAGSVDTSARPGSVGVTDTAVGGAGATSTPLPGADTSSAGGGAVTDTMPPAGDTIRPPADSTKPGSTAGPGTESNGSAESGGSTKPSL